MIGSSGDLFGTPIGTLRRFIKSSLLSLFEADILIGLLESKKFIQILRHNFISEILEPLLTQNMDVRMGVCIPVWVCECTGMCVSVTRSQHLVEKLWSG